MVDNVVISGATEDISGSGLKSPDSNESSSGSRNAHVNLAQYLFSNRKYRKGRARAMAAPSSEDNRKRCPGFFAG